MTRQPISAAIVAALSFAPALADEPQPSASLIAAAPEQALASAPDAGPLPSEEIGPDTGTPPFFDENLSPEDRNAALREVWRTLPNASPEFLEAAH